MRITDKKNKKNVLPMTSLKNHPMYIFSRGIEQSIMPEKKLFAVEATTAEATAVARTIWLRDETPDVSSDDDTSSNPATTPAEPDQLTGDNPVRQAGDPDQSPTLVALIQMQQSMATQTQALTATFTKLVVQRNLLDPPAAGNNAGTVPLAGTSNPAVDNQVFPNAWGKVYSILGVTIGTCVGVHPRMVNSYIPWNRLEALISGPRCVGVGEYGLDATMPELEPQKELFCRQVLLAKQTGLPLVLHVRDDKDPDSSSLPTPCSASAGHLRDSPRSVSLQHKYASSAWHWRPMPCTCHLHCTRPTHRSSCGGWSGRWPNSATCWPH